MHILGFVSFVRGKKEKLVKSWIQIHFETEESQKKRKEKIFSNLRCCPVFFS